MNVIRHDAIGIEFVPHTVKMLDGVCNDPCVGRIAQQAFAVAFIKISLDRDMRFIAFLGDNSFRDERRKGISKAKGNKISGRFFGPMRKVAAPGHGGASLKRNEFPLGHG